MDAVWNDKMKAVSDAKEIGRYLHRRVYTTANVCGSDGTSCKTSDGVQADYATNLVAYGDYKTAGVDVYPGKSTLYVNAYDTAEATTQAADKAKIDVDAITSGYQNPEETAANNAYYKKKPARKTIYDYSKTATA